MSAPIKGRKPILARKCIIKGVSPTAASTILRDHDTIISNSKLKQKTLDTSLSRKQSILKDQSNAAKKMIKKGSKEDVAGSHQTETLTLKPALKKVKWALLAYDGLSPPVSIKKVALTTIVIDSDSEESPFASISKAPIDMSDTREGSLKMDIKGKGKEIPPYPKKKSEEFINEMSGPEVAQHMSGNHVHLPSGFAGNSKATVYYTAVGARSVTMVSHAAIHSLHIQLLSLQDSMHYTAIEEEHLNMDLIAAGCSTMHFPGFLPNHLNDLSSALHLLNHFHQEEVAQYASNTTLSLFTVVCNAVRPKLHVTKDLV
ncbi:hypothetical protein F5146DRAFT_1129908 [Armillaria mellea]|nr:hypothetical protein F5146DRAFT_1129908 [Armillaria mellea]